MWGCENTAYGIRVTVYDTPEADGDFVPYDGGLLDRKVPHTIKFWIKLNPGDDDDLVRIYIDGQDLGQCFTTWENFYRTVPEPVPTINSLEFRSSGDEVASLIGGGYLFDNVTTTTADGAGPPGCNLPVEKTADSPTVNAGGQAGYQITVRNRGRLAARNLQAGDHIPARMTFVSSDRKLVRVGRQRCLMIRRLAPGQRVSFHLVLRVAASAPPGTVDNVVDIIPIPDINPDRLPGGAIPGLPAPVPDLPVQAVVRAKGKILSRTLGRVKIRRRVQERPRVTG